ncbi:MAG: CHAT domain-containing protein [Magnetococcus sp. WYHC-3]
MLIYHLSGEHLVALVVTWDAVFGKVLDGAGVSGKVLEYARALRQSTGTGHTETGQWLSRRLLEPILGDIQTRNLTVVAHGVLNYLPFAALPRKDGVLLDEFSVRHAASGAELVRLAGRDEVTSPGRLLLAAGGEGENRRQTALLLAREEALAQAESGLKVQVLLDHQATPERLLDALPQFRLAVVLQPVDVPGDRPWNARVPLAPDAAGRDGLTLRELLGRNLGNDLVMLPLARVWPKVENQGVELPVMTQLFAGEAVASWLVSQWRVEETVVTLFLRHLLTALRTTDKRNALREAQLAVRREAGEHPHQWAGFFLWGAAR